jgi:hypothetical protein
MNSIVTKRTESRDERPRRVFGMITAVFVGFARRAGGSLHRHPMPELREVSREWRRHA